MRSGPCARDFLREIVVVVLGVPIALAARQVVETLSWREQVRVFRGGVGEEIAYDLGACQDRLEQSRCIDWPSRARLARRLGVSSRRDRDDPLPPGLCRPFRPAGATG